MAPISWNGSQVIYNRVVRPIFLRHEALVDNIVSDLGGKAMDAAENLTREGTDHYATTSPSEKQTLVPVSPSVSFLSAVLSTLMKNKALVSPEAPDAQPEPKSLPSTSSTKVAPTEPEEQRQVCTPLRKGTQTSYF